MKALRLLAAGAALFAFASCGKEYNSVPGGNNTDNPILPLGVAGEGEIRFNLWKEKIRITGAFWNDTTYGSVKVRQVVGGMKTVDSMIQQLGFLCIVGDSAKKEYKGKDSLTVNFSIVSPTDLTLENARIFTNQVPGTKGGDFTVTFTEQTATTLRGTFSGKLARQYATLDTNDVVEINNGTFWVKKK